MQALYAHELAIASLKEIHAEKVAEAFEYDPAFHDLTEKPLFDKKVRFVKRTFIEKIENPKSDPGKLDEDVTQALEDGAREFANVVNSEQRSARKRMEEEIHNIHRLYLKLLLLPGEIAFLERKEKEKQESKANGVKGGNEFNFAKNPVIDALTTYKPLVDKAITEKVSWSGEEEQLKSWYKKVWGKKDDFIDYQSKSGPTNDEHFDAAKLLLKNLVFKTDEVDAYMATQDLHWGENKAILKSMISKTIQSYEPDLEDAFELKTLSLNEKDDFEYFRLLFDKTVKEDRQLEEIIAKKTHNWDMSRVAAIDKIILKMAITEMQSFPSIPVKVTINEFIEISKKYSTPKSKQFVNGILDVLANELTSEGAIKKSGRGLIDNK